MPKIDLTDEEYQVFSDVIIPFTISEPCIDYLYSLGEEKAELFLSAMEKFARFDHLLKEIVI